MDQRIILSFKSCHLKNTFCRAIAAIDTDSSDESWKTQLKSFWKIFTILVTIKTIHDSN